MRRSFLTVFGMTALATLTAVGVSGCKSKAAADPAAEQMVIGTENIVVAGRGTVTDGPTISGSLTAEQMATIRAQVSGSIISTSVEPGQPVSKGSLLGTIDATAIQDAYQSAKSAVTSAQSNYDLAQRNLQRQQTLLQAGAIATRDLETAQQTVASMRAALEDAKSRFTTAQKNLSDTRIVAPFSGVVSERSVSAGDVVQPGTALFTVIDPRTMRLDASVAAERVADLHVGTPVTFAVTGYGDQRFEGKITRINPAADPSTRQVRILASIPNTGSRLVAGLFAEGRISSRSREGIVVPLTAIDTRSQTPVVMRLHNGQVERTNVQLGMRDMQAETIEVTSGVQAGDTLLVAAAQGITPGTPVRVQAPPADRAQ